jgi:hypothetical protein
MGGEMMTMNNFKKYMLTGCAALMLPHIGQANLEELVPEINPTNACKLKHVKSVDGHPEYRYLQNSNCSAIFVYPPAQVEPQVTFTSSGLMGMCPSVKATIARINAANEEMVLYRDKREELNLLKFETESEQERQKLEARIEEISAAIESVKEDLSWDQDHLSNEYGNMDGGMIGYAFNSEISESHLEEIERANVDIVEVHKGGEVTYEYRGPTVSRAKMGNSLYSFTPASDFGTPMIKQVHVTGGELLQQEGAQSNQIHIRAGNVTGASILVNLPNVCAGAQLDKTTGNYKLSKEEQQKVFVVARTFDIQQRFTYGFEASLNIYETVNNITNEFISKGNYGSTLRQIFNQDIDVYLENNLTFKWKETYATENTQIGLTEILELKSALFRGFVEDYFEQLVASNKLTLHDAQETGQTDIVTTTETHKSSSCSGVKIGGFRLGGGCSRSTYTLTTYHDAWTDKDINNYLTIDQVFEEEVEAQRMHPFTYTTLFIFDDSKEQQGELQ